MAKDKKEKKPMDSKTKRAMIVGIVLALIFAIFVCGFSAIKLSGNALSSAISVVMPKTYEYKNGDTEITFYSEKNKDFDAKENQPLDAYTVYYFDEGGKKIVLENGEYATGELNEKGKEKKENITLAFLILTQVRFRKIQAVLKVVAIVYAVIVLAYLIYIWYLSWSRRYDKQKELNNPNNKEE